MRLAIIVVIVGAAHVAEARSHCREVSDVVGYRACHRFAGWSHGAGMWWELGESMLRFESAQGEELHARGMRFRNVGSFGAWYFGSQLDLASVTDGPTVIARDTTVPDSAGAFVAQENLVIGRHARTGALMFGGELAPGVRLVSLPGRIFQGWFVVDAQVKADVWLTPNFTLGASAGIDLLNDHGVTFAITLGAHLVPYDHTR